ncbi:YesN/AraC family two-component response regulator [Paenibacillus phyllosphaerae]|uniref:YesN/AraC family two-component response regulator n=1 Tax=Paenibacillus phyllosphaerae TaxID=274593 RepID=A0A7W5FQX6_9BACL|nr:response regulator [Paenibacillus phyllosphaerae]MBB3113697.1 YesN/AraC family two-component response regulator [Paenibacillus phyllosphaerae]
MKVLIVDDEPFILQGLMKIVKEVAPDHTSVTAANNAYEALDMMKDRMPDVTITDLNMPVIDGFGLIAEAKQQQLCARFIILTGYDQFEYARQAIRSGVIDYLLKPVNREELSELLHGIASELPASCDSDYRHHADRILSYIQRNYTQELSLDALAEHTELHPNYISSLFKKETGTTFINFLNDLRINEAKKLLVTDPYLPVWQIGERVGYCNRHYFAKVFKKYTGTTPGEYRESRQVKGE